MDYYQGIVADYLCAERHLFVHPEFLIDLENSGPHVKGKSWYTDILAVDFSKKKLFLCEVSYSKTLVALVRRLKNWSDNWDAVCHSIHEHTQVSDTWGIQPWVFIPKNSFSIFDGRLKAMPALCFDLERTCLEKTAPWRYPALSTVIAAKAKAAEKTLAETESAADETPANA